MGKVVEINQNYIDVDSIVGIGKINKGVSSQGEWYEMQLVLLRGFFIISDTKEETLTAIKERLLAFKFNCIAESFTASSSYFKQAN